MGVGELRNADARPDEESNIVKRFKNFYTVRYEALVEKVTITDTTILIWDHPTQGTWDEFNWASDVNSFSIIVLDHPIQSMLDDFYLGDANEIYDETTVLFEYNWEE